MVTIFGTGLIRSLTSFCIPDYKALHCAVLICQSLRCVAVGTFDRLLLTGARISWPAAQLQASLPRVQPPPQELAEMNQRAAEVVRLLEEYRRLTHPESERRPTESIDASRAFEGNRPPKRPWEDIAQDDAAGNDSSYGEVCSIQP